MLLRILRPLLRAPVAALLAAALLAGACAPATSTRQPAVSAAAANVYPAAEWERWPAPEAAGYSGAGLAAAEERLREIDTTSFLVIVGGRVLFEYGDVSELSYLASVRKSILSMLYGIHEARGEIDLDDTLAELGIDDVQGLTDAEKQATIRNLLMARSGIYHPASNSGDNLADAPPRGSQAPGAYYLYSNWDFNALGSIFEQETGQSIYDAFQVDLANPLRLQEYDRSRHRRSGNAESSRHLAYHFTLSTRDMARIGYLMLREGRWENQRIVPADWVRESTSALTPLEEMNPPGRREGRQGYGYLWWVFDGPNVSGAWEGAFTGNGAYGQYIAVFPALDMVVVNKTAVPPYERQTSYGEINSVIQRVMDARCPGGACGR